MSPKIRYTIIIASAAITSLVDVLWAAWNNKAPQGGRGGGVAALFALFIVLFLPDFGRRNYEHAVAKVDDTDEEIEKVKKSLSALTRWVKIDNVDKSKQTKALFIATAIGTLFWDLGDVFAGYLMAWFPHLFPRH